MCVFKSGFKCSKGLAVWQPHWKGAAHAHRAGHHSETFPLISQDVYLFARQSDNGPPE